MTLRSRIAPLLTFALFFFGTRLAAAQSIEVANDRSLPRFDANGTQLQKRALQLNPEAINRQDCLDDQRVRFPLRLSGFAADSALEAWASVGGVDCAQQVNRAGEDQLCWRLVPNIPLQAAIDVDVPVRALISGAPPAKATSPVADASMCGAVDLSSISVQFLYFAPGDTATASVSKVLPLMVDTVGPLAPPLEGVEARAGGASVSWSNSGGEGGVTAITGVNVYCDALPAEGACASDALVPGAVPDAAFEQNHLCGSVTGNTGTSAVTGPLEVGVPHAIAIASTDAFGNIGELSEVRCATPAAADGDAGGGGCATAPGSASGGTALGIFLAAAASLRRRPHARARARK